MPFSSQFSIKCRIPEHFLLLMLLNEHGYWSWGSHNFSHYATPDQQRSALSYAYSLLNNIPEKAKKRPNSTSANS